MTPDWPIEIDGEAYKPVPESWIEHGVDDREGEGPQLLAVSVTVRDGRMCHVRYAHPTGTKVGVLTSGVTEGSGGLIPATLPEGRWPRSIAASRLEPVGELTLVEQHYLEEVWDDHVAEVLDAIPDQLGRTARDRTVATDGAGEDLKQTLDEVSQDPDALADELADGGDVVLQGREFTVSVSEKRSTGDYENVSPHATIEGEIPEPLAALDEAGRGEVRRQLLALHRDLQAVVERTADNRIKEPGHEDWSDPVGGER